MSQFGVYQSFYGIYIIIFRQYISLNIFNIKYIDFVIT